MRKAFVVYEVDLDLPSNAREGAIYDAVMNPVGSAVQGTKLIDWGYADDGQD